MNIFPDQLKQPITSFLHIPVIQNVSGYGVEICQNTIDDDQSAHCGSGMVTWGNHLAHGLFWAFDL